MDTKNVAPKKYFYYSEKTTLRKLNDVANKEAKPIMETLEQLDLQQAGPMEFIYFDCTEDLDKEFTLEIAIPVAEQKTYVGNKYAFKEVGEFKCISQVHHGDIAKLPEVYDTMFKKIFADNVKVTNEIREVYEHYEVNSSANNITEIQVG